MKQRYYWYYTYKINSQTDGLGRISCGVTSSFDRNCFPIGELFGVADHVFGDGYDIMILNTVRITEDDYMKIIARKHIGMLDGGNNANSKTDAIHS